MKIPALMESFRARLILLLALLLGVTLGVQYYVNLRSVRNNARLIVEQEQAIMSGVALGVNSLNSDQYLHVILRNFRYTLLNDQNGRVKNVLVVDDNGDVLDSIISQYTPHKRDDGTKIYYQIKDVPLPPLRSAVQFADEHQQLPAWIPSRGNARLGEAGAFYLPVETDKGRKYIIVVLGSANTLTNLLERQTSRSALYTLILLLVTTLVTGFFVWRFTRPIKELSIAARQVAAGNFDFRVPADRRDEMCTLAAAFHEMTAKLPSARSLESQLHQAEKGAMVGPFAP